MPRRGRTLILVTILNPTPPELLVDAKGRPYFLRDVDLTLDRFREMLAGEDLEVRAYLVGKLMRKAKPDDVFQFVTLAEIRELWPRVDRYLGPSREFWRWLLDLWPGGAGHAA